MLGLAVVGGVFATAAAPPTRASGLSAPGWDGSAPRRANAAQDAVQNEDSVAALDRARDAQRRFERRRLRHLPVTRDWGGGECDDRVGRMCWRHDTGSYWRPEPEAPEVTAARDELLDTLAAVAREIPGDRWVLGQRVWYLGEARRWEEALALARRCGTPERWWCAALEGLVLHGLARHPEAEARFEAALASMDSARAAAWVDSEEILDGEGRDALERARRDGREGAFRRRLWSYADPLWIVPGNDRRSEHFARRTVAVIREDARNPHGISWGSDLDELLLRYGWEVGWERLEAPPGSIEQRGGVVGHEHPESRTFVPPGRVLAEPLGQPAEAWVPVLDFAPAAYAPAHAPVFLPVPATLSVVPLGDSVLVAATYRLPEDTTRGTRQGLREARPASASAPVQAGLVLRTLDGEPGTGRTVRGRREGSLSVVVAPGSYVASVEVWDPGAGVAGRHRVALPAPAVPPGVASLSDLLLLSDGPEPVTLHEAVDRLLPELRIRAGGTFRVAWVVAGLGFRDEILSYRLSVEKADAGFFRRAGEWLGLLDREEPQRLVWEESGPESPGPTLRSVTMTLPGELSPGTHVLRLELGTAGRGTLVTERTVEVVTPGGSGD